MKGQKWPISISQYFLSIAKTSFEISRGEAEWNFKFFCGVWKPNSKMPNSTLRRRMFFINTTTFFHQLKNMWNLSQILRFWKICENLKFEPNSHRFWKICENLKFDLNSTDFKWWFWVESGVIVITQYFQMIQHIAFAIQNAHPHNHCWVDMNYLNIPSGIVLEWSEWLRLDGWGPLKIIEKCLIQIDTK